MIYVLHAVGLSRLCSRANNKNRPPEHLSFRQKRNVWGFDFGRQRSPAPFTSALSAVLPDGGSVARLDVAVARVYPLLYFDKEEDRTGEVTRTGLLESWSDWFG